MISSTFSKYLFLILLFYQTSNSQQHHLNKIEEKKLEVTFKKIQKLIKTNSVQNHFLAYKILKKTEQEIKSKNDTVNLLFFNRNCIDLFAQNYSFSVSNNYALKSLIILQKYKDKKELGLLYRSIGGLRSYEEIENLREGVYNYYSAYQYYLKGEKLLRKYGNHEENIEVNYSLSYIEKYNNEWQKSINHAMISLKKIRISKTNGLSNIGPSLYLIIADNYKNLGKNDSVYKYLKLIDKNKLSYESGIYPSILLNRLKANYFYNIKDFTKAVTFYQIVEKKFDTLYHQELNIVTDVNKRNNELRFENLENKRKDNENKLRYISETYKNYMLIFGFILIIILSVLVVTQRKASKYKTQINRTLQEKNRELKIALEIKRTFLNTVTHELKTPLNTIKGIIHLLENEKSDKQRKIYSKNLSFSSDYLLGFINNIIDYRTLEKKESIQLKNNDVNIKDILISIIEIVKIKNENNNKIILNFDHAIPEVLKIDSVKLIQIIVELMTNAIKFTKNGEIILWVNLEELSDDKVYLGFKVVDTGIGILKEVQNEIFEPFIQESKEINRLYGGSGLGLSIVKETLGLFGSSIEMFSEKNKGTTFEFKIRFEVAQGNNFEENVEINSDEKESYSEIVVLLVEDNKINQLLTKKILVNKGFSCEVANNGAEAVAKVKEKNYSIILMDIMMPIMNGFEASEIISKLKPEIPIIALTAISEKTNSVEFQKAKILEKLDKPINVDILFNTILKYVN